MKNRVVVVLLVALMVTNGLVLGTFPAFASTFPTKEIKVIVPWSPGGATDVMVRALQPIFKSKFGANLVVLNKPGGSSAVGLTEMIAAKPDGYTIGIASSSILSLMALNEVPWRTDKFTNIALISEDPLILIVKADGRFKSLDDFMKAVVENPGKITVGTPGSRNVNHCMSLLAAEAAGAEIRHVPFGGASDALAALLGGHIDSVVAKPNDAMGQLKSGDAKAIGVFMHERSPALPDVPSFKEAGYDVFKYGKMAQVSFMVAPAGVPEDVQEKLASMFYEVIKSDEFQELARNNGFIAEPIIGDELDAYIAELYGSLENIAKKAFAE